MKKLCALDLFTLEAFAERQRQNLLDAILSLHNYTLYANISSKLAIPGEIDSVIKELETIYKDIYVD